MLAIVVLSKITNPEPPTTNHPRLTSAVGFWLKNLVPVPRRESAELLKIRSATGSKDFGGAAVELVESARVVQ